MTRETKVYRDTYRAPAELIVHVRTLIAERGLLATCRDTNIARCSVERIAGDLPMRQGTITMACVHVGLGVPAFPSTSERIPPRAFIPRDAQHVSSHEPTMKPAA